MAVKTISIKTNAALGTLAEAMLAAVEVNLKKKDVFTRPSVYFGYQMLHIVVQKSKCS